MVSRMSRRGPSDKLPILLFGFTGMGMLLAASITAIFYFGSDFLNSDKTVASATTPPTTQTATADQAAITAQDGAAKPKIEELLGKLSEDQLSTVQKMLLEREAAEVATSETSPDEPSLSQEPTVEQPSLSETSRLQAIVDSYSVQGIRKAGQETRVFLNGRIRKIGDVVDIENRLQLIGFTDTTLVFEDSSGTRFEKTL